MNISSFTWPEDGVLNVLSFSIGADYLAIPAVSVREILEIGNETRVPSAHSMVDRIINFRGRVIPLLDLRPAFAIELGELTVDSRIIVVELPSDIGVEIIGLRADRVHEVTTLHECNAEDPPDIGLRWPREHARHLVRHEGSVVILPDLARLIGGIS